MNKEQALHSFWSSFGLTAYDENSVPDSAVLPYITYETVTDTFGNVCNMSASLWYTATSWQLPTEKKQQIENVIKHGKTVKYDNGVMFITTGSPFAQRMGDETSKIIKRVILNIRCEYLD